MMLAEEYKLTTTGLLFAKLDLDSETKSDELPTNSYLVDFRNELLSLNDKFQKPITNPARQLTVFERSRTTSFHFGPMEIIDENESKQSRSVSSEYDALLDDHVCSYLSAALQGKYHSGKNETDPFISSGLQVAESLEELEEFLKADPTALSKEDRDEFVKYIKDAIEILKLFNNRNEVNTLELNDKIINFRCNVGSKLTNFKEANDKQSLEDQRKRDAKLRTYKLMGDICEYFSIAAAIVGIGLINLGMLLFTFTRHIPLCAAMAVVGGLLAATAIATSKAADKCHAMQAELKSSRPDSNPSHNTITNAYTGLASFGAEADTAVNNGNRFR